MKYWNQLQFEDMPYPTNINEPESDLAVNGTVKRAGCGLCALCMVIDRLCLEEFSLEECRDFSISVEANRDPGTNMKILAPAAAQKFDLELEMTDNIEHLVACLREGGAALVNVGGDRENYTGIFSHIGHYIAVISIQGDEVCILDPSWEENKYTQEPRKSSVRQSGMWLYTPKEVLRKDSENRSPGFYLFARRSDHLQ